MRTGERRDNGHFYVCMKGSWPRFKAGMEGLLFGRRESILVITRGNRTYWLFVWCWEEEAIAASSTSISLYSRSKVTC